MNRVFLNWVGQRRMKMIEELLNQYSTDGFDDLLIEIIKRMKERKESEKENEDE